MAELWLFLQTPGAGLILLDKGVLALVLALFGLWVSRKLESYKSLLAARNAEAQQARQGELEERKEGRAVKQQALQADLERTSVPRTQVDIQCRFYDLDTQRIIIDVAVIVENKGQRIRGIKSMRFRIFTMQRPEQAEIRSCRDGANRLYLSGPSITEEVGYVFSVEPGIKQIFPLTTTIDADTRYVVVKVDLNMTEWDNKGSPWLGESRLVPVVLESDGKCISGQSVSLGAAIPVPKFPTPSAERF